MASLIQKIGSLSMKLFKRSRNRQYITPDPQEFEKLTHLLNSISINELNIDQSLLQDFGPYNPISREAPVTYMLLHEDRDITICIFILKNGVKLPLHDHPGMYGLLKVIHGEVSIQSYTMDRQSENSNVILNGKPVPGLHEAIKHPVVSVRESDPVCVLKPECNNLHEIGSVCGPAAFLDILSPPYGKDHLINIERDCHYYQEISPKGDDPNHVLLLNITTPEDFYCDQALYKGPPICEFTLNGEG